MFKEGDGSRGLVQEGTIGGSSFWKRIARLCRRRGDFAEQLSRPGDDRDPTSDNDNDGFPDADNVR